MTHRKIVNRMRKAQRVSSLKMSELIEVGMVGGLGENDVEIHNICVDAHNVHVGIWNKLQRYINQLTRKPVAVKSKGVQS
ncbi:MULTISPECIES: hypothetical protein [Enterobacter cloacae complex]|uniref:hypothetical protein n=1 Tax=Enterobacter cloacae complex TaxID=354276 RepID=UPI001011BBEF|nr:hypothetical protein [Enterobacter cloacae]MDR9913264.1 hypothetical protein [Enterobacter cloacae subsp. cloacae]RXX64394.1 hypothetical protein DD600_17105 [Enterobacter cloacae]HCT2370542.1 hypothetical protein [Enterobacter cloacae]HDT6027738.1 hypothetical protein [Enterobacter cloacae subsp. cloacae]HDT6093807.1 hypothetical protein [Enterobacter cloacae subsp. cloacae]